MHKLIALNIPSTRVAETVPFYSRLLQEEYALALHKTIRAEHIPMVGGVWLWISPPLHPEDRNITPYFGVEDIKQAVKDAEERGCRCLVPPSEMTMDESALDFFQRSLDSLGVEEELTLKWGEFSLFLDPSQHPVGLIQVEPHSHVFYGLGKYAQPGEYYGQIVREHRSGKEFAKELYSPERSQAALEMSR